ncbi:MAG: bifunctional chorismate mutase/prephenate dehydrogenase [Cyanobacteriota bacterium]|nr:bifunctional chorismate mutase/prephenate dehydrogenase [Cyanobacteriota bacterium]
MSQSNFNKQDNKQENLKEIDEQLVRLLGKRIAVLERDRGISRTDRRAYLQPLLAKAGVPEFVWEKLETCCTAALATSDLATLKTPPKQIAIVGGKGMMGQFFRSRFLAAGHQVKALGRQDWSDAETLLEDIDLALICVPIDRTLEIIQKTAKYLPQKAVLADITSIKAPMVEAMLTHHSGPVVGLHPMFGPGVKSFLSQKVVVCPGREDKASAWLIELMEKDGGDLVFCSAQEHDRMTIAVQALRHFSTYSLGVFLAEEGVDIGRSLELSSPIYRMGVNLVSRLFAQDAQLYADIMLATAERREAIARLASTFSRLAKAIEWEDRSMVIEEFDRTAKALGTETDRALRESDKLIDSLSILLAANRVENAIDG